MYRFVVRDSSGNTSTVELTMPHAIPTLTLSEDGLTATVEGAENDRLLFLTVVYRTIVDPLQPWFDSFTMPFTFQYALRVSRTDTGYTANFTWKDDVRNAFNRSSTVTLTGVDAEVGMVHRDAPEYGLIPSSNIENSIRYLAGIATEEASVTIPPDERPQIAVGE